MALAVIVRVHLQRRTAGRRPQGAALLEGALEGGAVGPAVEPAQGSGSAGKRSIAAPTMIVV